MDEGVQVEFEALSSVKLADYGIRTIKNRTLLAPGFWNGRNYSREEITKAYNQTNWEDKDVISLIADHRDDDSKGRPLTIRDWVGFISNPKLRDDGFVIGDLNFCDSDLSLKLIEGKAPFGISPFVYGKHDKLNNSQKDFIFKNFAVVVEPACKESYINAYLGDDGLNLELDKLSIDERIKTKLSETTTTDVRGKEVESHGLQPVKTKKKKKVDSIEVKGGKTNMENKLEETTESKEVVDELSETVEDNPTDGLEEETKDEPNEESEEESEEKLMEQLAKITEKLMNKRKITPEQAKMQKLESELVSLRNEIKKLQEDKPEEPEEKSKEESEKLSAKPRTRVSTVQTEQGFSVFGKGASNGSRELAGMLGL